MVMPINVNGHAVRTVAQWQAAAPRLGVRTWKGAMRRAALADGKAIAMLSNDGAIFMERDPGTATGTRTTVLAPSEVEWVGR